MGLDLAIEECLEEALMPSDCYFLVEQWDYIVQD
ncbi:hypothetical protein BLA29_015423 [Euroglyphus maynei]|uniref:Uncharacterized protein n=1 Tax=Euroglyphus maynei TaxID=6958 RepID=A0A1Y3BKM0_EURMA|nr:hypothetical protein BLA29_015423 [Euroglyphus maynei]